MSAIGESLYVLRVFAGIIFGIAKFCAWISVSICGIQWLWRCYKTASLVYDISMLKAIVALVAAYIACYIVTRFWSDVTNEMSLIDGVEENNWQVRRY